MASCENTKQTTQYDAVHKPAHYTDGRKFEPKDVIRDWGLNFNVGSAVKYLSRAGRKDDIVQDLRKAQEFIQFEIDAILLERETGSRVKEECTNLCDTCMYNGIENCPVAFLARKVTEEVDSCITKCEYHISDKVKISELKKAFEESSLIHIKEPVFAEMENGKGVSYGVMELKVPANIPPEDIIKMVINELYGGE